VKERFMKLQNLIVLLLLLLTSAYVSSSWSLPAPKYLSVPYWKSCTRVITKGTAQFVCLPSDKPAQCPQQSWEALTGQQLVASCAVENQQPQNLKNPNGAS
jgi:hypothetical protein